MRINVARALPIALMALLAGLTFWLERAVREELPAASERRHEPDYIITNFTTTTYDRDGTPKSVLSAQKMFHYPDDDSTELVAPRVVQTRPGEPRVTVRADRGTLSRAGDDIFLYDNVVMVRDADRQRPAARITTSFLHVVRDRSLVRTDRPVRIEEERRTLTGRGMEYDSEARRLQLFADVRGTFEPRKAP